MYLGSDGFMFRSLLSHVGHHLECVTYGNKDTGILNVSVECTDCNEVLFDIDNPKFKEGYKDEETDS